VVKITFVALQCCMLQTLKVYNNNLLFVVRMHMFGSDRMLLSWIVKGWNNMFKLYLDPRGVKPLGRPRVLFWLCSCVVVG